MRDYIALLLIAPQLVLFNTFHSFAAHTFCVIFHAWNLRGTTKYVRDCFWRNNSAIYQRKVCQIKFCIISELRC